MSDQNESMRSHMQWATYRVTGVLTDGARLAVDALPWRLQGASG